MMFFDCCLRGSFQIALAALPMFAFLVLLEQRQYRTTRPYATKASELRADTSDAILTTKAAAAEASRESAGLSQTSGESGVTTSDSSNSTGKSSATAES